MFGLIHGGTDSSVSLGIENCGRVMRQSEVVVQSTLTFVAKQYWKSHLPGPSMFHTWSEKFTDVLTCCNATVTYMLLTIKYELTAGIKRFETDGSITCTIVLLHDREKLPYLFYKRYLVNTRAYVYISTLYRWPCFSCDWQNSLQWNS